MGKICARQETGRPYLDFSYQGVRCREQTLLEDNPGNRKQLQQLLSKVEARIMPGEFNYAEFFPNRNNAIKVKQREVSDEKRRPAQQSTQMRLEGHIPTVGKFAEQWFSEKRVE